MTDTMQHNPSLPGTASATAATRAGSVNSADALARLAATIESRKPAAGGDASTSYVARLLQRGPDAFLKKIGEEATEVVMAAKDADRLPGGTPGADEARQKLVNEVADLWFHSMVALAHYGAAPADVVAELERREGTSGIEEKALRKAVQREAAEVGQPTPSSPLASPGGRKESGP